MNRYLQLYSKMSLFDKNLKFHQFAVEAKVLAQNKKPVLNSYLI